MPGKVTAESAGTRPGSTPKSSRRKLGLGMLLLACLAPLVLGDGVGERRFALPAKGATVEVYTASASVRVRGGAGKEAVLGPLRQSVAKRLKVRSSGPRLVIRLSAGQDLDLRLPATVDLRVVTQSGDLSVEGIEGEVELESSSGDQRVSGQPRVVRMDSGSGDLELRGVGKVVTERIEARSISGTVDLSGLFRQVRGESVSGMVRLDSAQPRSARLETVSGPVVARLTAVVRGDLELSSHSGDVRLELAKGSSAALDAHTHSGRIDSSVGQVLRQKYGGEDLSVTLGRGEGRISLQTFSGRIRLRVVPGAG